MLKVERINAFRQRTLVLDLEGNARPLDKYEASYNIRFGRKTYQLQAGTYEVIFDPELFSFLDYPKNSLFENGIILYLNSETKTGLLTVTNGFLSIEEGSVISVVWEQEAEFPDAEEESSEPIRQDQEETEEQMELLLTEEMEEKPTKKWWTNGTESVKAFESPGEEWRRGRVGAFSKKEKENNES